MKVRKAVIPAAGLGTRFLPATKSQPKEMLPIVDKPTIQYIIEEAAAAGVEDIIVVTRYFGGIKLGAGGLVRAYSHTAALGIASSKIVRMTTFIKISLTLEYNFLATVENYLRGKKIRVDSSDYADVVTLEILLLPAQVEKFLIDMNDLTAANFLHEELGEILLPVEM